MWIYGHRGAPAAYPENTLSSFECALTQGADALETDVRVSRDGRVVVFHDANASRIVGRPESIESSDWQDIQGWDAGYSYLADDGSRPFVGEGMHPPLLEDVLRRFPEVRFNIDIKSGTERAIDATIETIRTLKAQDRVLLTSFVSSARGALIRKSYEGPLGFGLRQVLALRYLPSALLRAWIRPRDRIQIPILQSGIRFEHVGFIKKMKALEIAVDFWTINDPTVAKRLQGLGADGVMTDNPKLLVDALR